MFVFHNIIQNIFMTYIQKNIKTKEKKQYK